jgi:activator of HSP90 ATPase
MSDLVQLTDAEVDLVSGGFVAQVNYSDIDQSASASNSGGVAASASGSHSTAIAVGAAASNTAEVLQANVFSIRVGRHR